MSKLISKARAGVTLVELLVVILIVTILSVSMLPLLQPFVVESQYAAEAIPVIGNIRTKVGVYVYDKGHLPYDKVLNTADKVETWCEDPSNADVYIPCLYDYKDWGKSARTASATSQDKVTKADTATKMAGHITGLLDIDYQDLKGKRSKPPHFQYLALNTNTMSYVVGCFGDGNGLKAGTGYAVCELNFPAANRKLIGTWKRYKSYNEQGGAIVFTQNSTADTKTGKVFDCYVPKESELTAATTSEKVETTIVDTMKKAGWEF